jgi:hypothetical protein
VIENATHIKFHANTYNVEFYLDDDARIKARRAAPGWDIYRLMKIYNQGIKDGLRKPPDFPEKAFPVWCARYTKGRPP